MRYRHGLSLVENIVSFLLITLLLLGVLNLFPGSLQANRRAELALQAQTVAEQILEEQRSQGFASLSLGLRPWQTIIVNDNRYQARLEITSLSGKDPQTLRALKLRIAWTVAGRQQVLRREVWVSNVRS